MTATAEAAAVLDVATANAPLPAPMEAAPVTAEVIDPEPRRGRKPKSAAPATGLYGAWVDAWGEMQNAARNKLNPFTKGRYADLSAVLAVVRPCLAKHGLALRHEVQVINAYLFVDTIIFNRNGDEMRAGWYPVAGLNSNPQGLGAALTYAKRFQLSALLCLASDDDDDGNTAQKQARMTEADHSREPGQMPPQIQLNPELESKARAAAGNGAYQAFWGQITNEQRTALINSGLHAQLKGAA